MVMMVVVAVAMPVAVLVAMAVVVRMAVMAPMIVAPVVVPVVVVVRVRHGAYVSPRGDRINAARTPAPPRRAGRPSVPPAG